MLRVGLVMHGSAMPLETALAAEVFGTDRTDITVNGDWYDFVVLTQDGQPHPWLAAATTLPFGDLAGMDTLIVTSVDDLEAEPDPQLLQYLRDAHHQGTRISSLCTGAFLLASAGILDGRVATTHWSHASELAAKFPLVRVRSDVIYVDDGDVLTSAGKTAALDLCIHLVGMDFGAAAANRVAQQLVVPAHRSAQQAQVVTAPATPQMSKPLASTLEWARAHLDQPLTVGDLATHAGLSTRQLARRMQVELQSAPLDWLHHQRISRARELLERTDVSIEAVAVSCGMSSATTLRRHFSRTLGISPRAYRNAFRLA